MVSKYTLDTIKDFIFEELGFDWSDKQVQDTKTNKYRRAKLSDFNTVAYLSVKISPKVPHYALRVTANEQKFIVRDARTKIDMSQAWQDKINNIEPKINEEQLVNIK